LIARYQTAEMAALWTDRRRYESWLEVELAVADAWTELGRIPPGAADRMRRSARIDPDRIDSLERSLRHDVLAFTTQVGETLGEDSRFFHLGLTSSDVVDTAQALVLREAAALVIAELEQLAVALAEEARRYRRTPCIGRTHGVHAEPTTFGLKLAGHYAAFARDAKRLQEAREAVSTGKISGSVGTYANVPPPVEASVCRRLRLQVEAAGTQVVPRDRHAHLLVTLALLGANLERLAVEVRHLQRTEVGELREPFREGQKGSSSMPHKRNPVEAEKITGLARLLRSNAQAALENVALWHERDISHSSVERVILPDSTTLAHYLLRAMTQLVTGWRVDEERMLANLEFRGGIVFSQQVLHALLEAGWSREDAYALVQSEALAAGDEGGSFRARIAGRADLPFDAERLEACFDLAAHLAHLDTVFARLGLG
jgi:adenylosuccinate lyase